MVPSTRPVGDVSVVMATYNGARYVKQQLRSIIDQSHPPVEIVIGDDGSTDDTVAVIERVAAESAIPIRLTVNAERLGYGANFLAAASRAIGRYIAFSDQDDVWYPNKIERSLAALGEPGVLLVAHQMNLVDAEGVFLRRDTHGTDRTVRMQPGRADPFGVFFGFTMTFDGRLLGVLPADRRGRDSYRPDDVLPHDRWVHLLGTTFGSAELIAEPLADYRQHDSQVFGVMPQTRLDRVRKKLREGPRQVAALQEIAHSRVAVITESRPRGPVPADAFPSAQQWDAAADRWRAVSRMIDRRACTYLGRGVPNRTGAWLANAFHGAYRSHRHGGLGPQHAVEDIVAGVAGPAARRALRVPRS